MRFRKRIRLAKGLNVNLSKSGAGFSIGGRGASLSFGKQGAFLNTSIPGTGLYSRKKISRTRRKSSGQTVTEVEIQFYVEIDDEGSPFIFWGTDGILPNGTEMSYGESITDNAVLRQIRKSEVYKERLIQASLEKRNALNEQNQIFTSLHKKSPKILGVADLELERIKIDSENYREKLADELKPDRNKYRSKLEIEAKSAVNSILFWKNKSKRRDYVEGLKFGITH